MRKNKLKVETLFVRKATKEELQQMDDILKKEKEKHECDLNCGGISDDGYSYIRLHDRHEKK